MKKCGKCLLEKEEACFGKSYSRKDGLQPYCKECRNKNISKDGSLTKDQTIIKNLKEEIKLLKSSEQKVSWLEDVHNQIVQRIKSSQKVAPFKHALFVEEDTGNIFCLRYYTSLQNKVYFMIDYQNKKYYESNELIKPDKPTFTMPCTAPK